MSLSALKLYGSDQSDSNDSSDGEEMTAHLRPVESKESVVKDLVKVESAPLVTAAVSTIT